MTSIPMILVVTSVTSELVKSFTKAGASACFLYSWFAVSGFESNPFEFFMSTQFFVDPTSVFWFGVHRYFLYTLSGDDEFEAGISEDYGHKTLASTSTIFGDNAR